MDNETFEDAAPSSGAPPPRLPVIPDHELLKCIGEGGYGQIWLVRNILGSYRAAKVVFRSNFTSAQPFEQEFRGIMTFEPISRTHEGLVQVLQVGKNDQEGYFYYVMELADDQFTRQLVYPDMYVAKTLESEIRLRGRLPAQECVQIGLSLTAALHHLHTRSLVHRDIKPSNLIYLDGRIKMADIGLVADVRNAKSFVGTDGFFPPEGPGTIQADIYSVGKVLYEAVTGKDRFDFPAASTRLGEFSDKREVNKLAKVLQKACAEDRQKRYSSVQALHNDLKHLQRQLPSPTNLRRWFKHPLTIVGIIVVALASAIILSLVSVGYYAIILGRHLVVEDWYGPTNVAELPAPIGKLTTKSDDDPKLYVCMNVNVGKQILESSLVPANELPKNLSARRGSETLWRSSTKASAFLLQSGLRTIPAVRIAARSAGSSPDDGSTEVEVYTPDKPESLSLSLVFETPRNIDLKTWNLEYLSGARPVITAIPARPQARPIP